MSPPDVTSESVNGRGLGGPSAEAEHFAARRGSLAHQRHLRWRLRSIPEAGMPGMGLMSAPSPRPTPDPGNRPVRRRSQRAGPVLGRRQRISRDPLVTNRAPNCGNGGEGGRPARCGVAALRRCGGPTVGGIRSDRRSIRARVIPITGGAVLSRPGRALVGDPTSSRHASSGFRVDRTRTHLRPHRGPTALRAREAPGLASTSRNGLPGPERHSEIYRIHRHDAPIRDYRAMSSIRPLVALLAVARQGHLIFSRLGRRLPAGPDVEHARSNEVNRPTIHGKRR